MSNKKVERVFILMLENHSFDNVFGASGINGINGINHNSINSYRGDVYKAGSPAPNAMYSDPGHEFLDTVQQLNGNAEAYKPFDQYPPINNSGFVANFATSTTEDGSSAPHPTPEHYGDVMHCFDTKNQLPMTYALANEFAVCDNWFSSMPGPTWPNRFFAYAASSSSLDDSPSTLEMGLWEGPGGGIEFPHGSVFDLLRNHSDSFKLYQDGLSHASFPIVLGLKGISYSDMNSFENFEHDLHGDYPHRLTLIEPNYGNIFNKTYQGGSSQHPMDGMYAGEVLIKRVYEAIRSVEAIWETSMLIVTYDEHGGFYDSVPPPAAVPPGDFDHPGGPYSKNGFLFDRYGVRVPAVVVSPFIPKNTVCNTLFDHTSMLKTLEEVANLPPLTQRDAHANSLLPILSEKSPRTDCPMTLDAFMEQSHEEIRNLSEEDLNQLYNEPLPESGNLIGFLTIANKIDHELSSGAEEEMYAITDTFRSISTMGHARDYMLHVLDKMRNY